MGKRGRPEGGSPNGRNQPRRAGLKTNLGATGTISCCGAALCSKMVPVAPMPVSIRALSDSKVWAQLPSDVGHMFPNTSWPLASTSPELAPQTSPMPDVDIDLHRDQKW